MKLLALLRDSIYLAGNRWALREIDPLHPDVPRIVRRIRELEDATRVAFAPCLPQLDAAASDRY